MQFKISIFVLFAIAVISKMVSGVAVKQSFNLTNPSYSSSEGDDDHENDGSKGYSPSNGGYGGGSSGGYSGSKSTKKYSGSKPGGGGGYSSGGKGTYSPPSQPPAPAAYPPSSKPNYPPAPSSEKSNYPDRSGSSRPSADGAYHYDGDERISVNVQHEHRLSDEQVGYIQSVADRLSSTVVVDYNTRSCDATAPNWLRASFHDAGTFNIYDGSGGADGSLYGELNFPQHRGVTPPSSAVSPLNAADTIQLAGAVAVKKCGGPLVPFRVGRVNVEGSAQNNVGRLPSPFISVNELRTVFQNMGLDDVDMFALTTGSHTMGGADVANTPDLQIFKQNPGLKQVFFDDTPGIFDNNIFVKLYKNPNDCVLPIDCYLWADPSLRSLGERWARDQSSFFAQYTTSFQKMAQMTGRAEWSNALNLRIQ
jgi:hypothetical protein